MNTRQRAPVQREESAIVLDYLPNGYPSSNLPLHRKTAIAQAIGKNFFTLLELVPKKESFLNPGDEVYIGEGKRDKIHHINGKLDVVKLTGTAQQELKFILTDLVQKSEARFVEFFNTCGPLSLRMHQLELLPGLGKKHMTEILDIREVEPFTDFGDIKARVKTLPPPADLIVKRIMLELEGTQKYNLFVKGVSQDRRDERNDRRSDRRDSRGSFQRR